MRSWHAKCLLFKPCAGYTKGVVGTMKKLLVLALALCLVGNVLAAPEETKKGPGQGTIGYVFCSINANCNGWEIYHNGVPISGPDLLGRHETLTVQLPRGWQTLTAKFYWNGDYRGSITDEVYVIAGTIMHCFVQAESILP